MREFDVDIMANIAVSHDQNIVIPHPAGMSALKLCNAKLEAF